MEGLFKITAHLRCLTQTLTSLHSNGIGLHSTYRQEQLIDFNFKRNGNSNNYRKFTYLYGGLMKKQRSKRLKEKVVAVGFNTFMLDAEHSSKLYIRI